MDESAGSDAPCKSFSREIVSVSPSSSVQKTQSFHENVSTAGSCRTSSASVGLFNTDIQTLIDGKCENASECGTGCGDEQGESLVCFLLKTGNKISKIPDTAAESLASEQHRSHEVCVEEKVHDEAACAKNRVNKISDSSTVTLPTAQSDVSFQKTPDQVEETFPVQSAETMPLENNAHNMTIYEDMPSLDMDEQLSCDISRLSLNETDVEKTVLLVQCTPTNVLEDTPRLPLEKNTCNMPYVSSVQLQETVCIDCAGDESPVTPSAAIDICLMENAGSSTEFTEIDSVIFVNKKTMAKK
eukprot:jgi/Antlo1/1289/2222